MTSPSNPHQDQRLYAEGAPLESARAAVVLVHGRGATASSILELRTAMNFRDVAYLAPQASGNTWYPYSFLAPLERNEPGLSSGLQALADAVAVAERAGLPPERMVLGGFSQGACLAAEFAARNARRFGGLLILSGGVIGPLGMVHSYPGSLAGTPVFIGCSDRDPHIPLARVNETADIFRSLGADVILKIYPDMGHTIVKDEIDHADRIIRSIPAEV